MNASLFVAAALVSIASLGTGIVNGLFDDPVPTNGTGAGWTSMHVDNLGGWQTAGGFSGPYFVLNDGGQAHSDPTLSQVVTGLVPGTLYVVSGRYASWYYNASPVGGSSFKVDVDGATAFTGTAGALQQWRSFAAPFTATGTTVVVTIRAEVDGSDNDFAVDSVAIAAVPDPNCRADLNSDQFVDDADFVLFAEAYNFLYCP
jgi:hypothetical protein